MRALSYQRLHLTWNNTIWCCWPSSGSSQSLTFSSRLERRRQLSEFGLGCRISSFRTTLWVASIGVLAGATFSSGMMEIARSGVFHPQLFTFSD